MTSQYRNPALEAELAYRREVLMAAGQQRRGRRWLRLRRTAH